jgi:hypothetical protein
VDNCAEALEQRYRASLTLTVPVPASPNASSWESVIDKEPTLSLAGEWSQLAKLLLKLDFTNLRKVSVLACSTANGDLGTTFFQDLCAGPASGKLTKLVAGYTGFVSMAHPKKNKELCSYNSKQFLSVEELEKVFAGGTFKVVVSREKGVRAQLGQCSAEQQAKNKKLHQYRGNSVA